MTAQNLAHFSNSSGGMARIAMIELGTMVTLDGRRRGVLVGRSFSAKDEAMAYDVQLSANRTILNVAAERVKAAGPARRDVIGRDLPHNPKRRHLLDEESERRAV